MSTRPAFQNFQVDHMTLLVQPELYKVAYVLFRNVFGVPKEEILYEKRKAWTPGGAESSMTFAMRLGQGANPKQELNNTVVAVVQPSEPKGTPSHVRDMLDNHKAAAHWQHIALRTPDLLAFHEHALSRGVRFVTPILQDDDEDLIQVFSGEWYFPGSTPSGVFFEFLERNPNDELLKKIKERNREVWFRDKTFMGLYEEKEREYRSGKVTPFIDPQLFDSLQEMVSPRNLWEISETDLKKADELMLSYGRKNE